jgi:hypothetical protein
LRDGRKRYDHCPIVTYFSWQGIPKGVGFVIDKQVQQLHMRWRPEFRNFYTDIVQTDGGVLSFLAKVRDPHTSVQESCQALTLAVTRAAEILHDRVGGVFVGNHAHFQNPNRIRIRWLSKEARVLRRQMKSAEQQNPVNWATVVELRKLYRKKVKQDRKIFMADRRAKIRKDMVSNVKNFWAKFKKGRPHAPIHTIEQWSTYFEKLFNEGKHDWSCEEVFENHCQKYDDLFGTPSEGDKDKAECLNYPITDNEVHEAFTAVNLGKTVGADRIPVEFFRQAFHEMRREGEDGKIRIIREYLLTPVLM